MEMMEQAVHLALMEHQAHQAHQELMELREWMVQVERVELTVHPAQAVLMVHLV
jgi:hypothetical protein